MKPSITSLEDAAGLRSMLKQRVPISLERNGLPLSVCRRLVDKSAKSVGQKARLMSARGSRPHAMPGDDFPCRG